jgi:hypothetical protein
MATAPNTYNPMGAAPLANPALAMDPNYVANMLRVQRQQQMAQALMQQGLDPISYDPHGRISWTQGANKLLSAYLGGKMGNDAISGQASNIAQGTQMQLGQLGAGQPSPAPGPSPSSVALSAGGGPTPANAALAQALTMPGASSSAPTPAPSNGIPGGVSPTSMNPGGLPPMLVLAARNGDPAAMKQVETLLANQTQTPEQRNVRDPIIGSTVQGNLQTQNMTPLQKLQLARRLVPDGSPQAAQIDAAISKENYIAPIDAKPGTPVLDPRTLKPVFFAPKTADGINLNFDNPLAPTAAAIPGYANANAGIAGAEQGAKQANTIFTGVPGVDGAKPGSGFGGTLFGGGGGGGGIRALPPAASPVAPVPGASGASAAVPAVPAARPGVILGPDPAVQAGREGQQKDMNARFSALQAEAGQVPNVNNYLDQIKLLAPKADTGQFSDRMQFTNSLLSLAGSDKATDALTAKNLLDKYSNQIVAQLGSGGLSTDAARAILGAAYPSSHMVAPAINEAVDSIKAINVKKQAKAQVLGPINGRNDPVTYNATEQEFDRAADPRIFQWKNIADPTQRAAYGAMILKQDPTLADKAQALQAMGVQ